MGRSTPSPAGARTEHRSPRVLPPLRACFPSMPKWPDGACQLADCHRCIPDCHTPHRKNDVPSKAVGVKHDGRRRLHCTTLSLLSYFCCFFVFSNTAKVEAVAAQVLNKITSDIPYRHPASRSTHSRNTSSTFFCFFVERRVASWSTGETPTHPLKIISDIPIRNSPSPKPTGLHCTTLSFPPPRSSIK